jgi:hypothetical protein
VTLKLIRCAVLQNASNERSENRHGLRESLVSGIAGEENLEPPRTGHRGQYLTARLSGVEELLVAGSAAVPAFCSLRVGVRLDPGMA